MTTHGITVTMTPSHPGDFIRTEVIEELGLSATRVAEILGVRRATLSKVLNGHVALSPEMALRIEKAFDISMDCRCECRLGMTPRKCAPVQMRSRFNATHPQAMDVFRVSWRVHSILRAPDCLGSDRTDLKPRPIVIFELTARQPINPIILEMPMATIDFYTWRR